MNAAERVLEKLHLKRHTEEVKVRDPEGKKVEGKERVPDPVTEHDVDPVVPPATDTAGPKVEVQTSQGARSQLNAHNT